MFWFDPCLCCFSAAFACSSGSLLALDARLGLGGAPFSLPPAQMANRDGDAGMETMLWDINIIPNELDNGYLMLPPGVLHMSALGSFGRFTLFSPRVSHSKHLPVFCFVLCFGFGVFVALWCFCFQFCKCLESRILRAV